MVRIPGSYIPDFEPFEYRNVDGFIATILDSGLATLHELKTIYSYEDGFYMWEVATVKKLNEIKAAKEATKKANHAKS